jgi:hypothetical protein
MNATVRKIYNKNGNETGAILTADVITPTNQKQKIEIERSLMDFVYQRLYPDEPLNIFSSVWSDTPSITVIRKLNELPDNNVPIT